jgi:excisionase family DNA binding protein
MAETLLSPEQLAQRMGVGKSTIYRLRQRGELGPQTLKVGGSSRFVESEVDAWLLAGCPPRRKWETIRTQKRAAR